MSALIDRVIDAAVLPDPVLRASSRLLLASRHRGLVKSGQQAAQIRRALLQETLFVGPIAVATDLANEQHYEVPAAFFQLMLGPRLKYSSGHWGFPSDEYPVRDLASAEERMLAITAQRAELADGQDILELGCGWGSLTLWMAEQYPDAKITAVSNSSTQRDFILKQAAEIGRDNVDVVTANVADLQLEKKFDRIVSVELFEHLRNHRAMMDRMADWIRPDGSFFVHVFAHRDWPYLFTDEGGGDWMSRNFFTGGMMPDHNWLAEASERWESVADWRIKGTHYARTCRAWLQNLDDNESEALNILGEVDDNPAAALARWRLFVIACEELFASANGTRWHVSHRRFKPVS